MKITMSNGYINYKWPFSIAVLDDQRVPFTSQTWWEIIHESWMDSSHVGWRVSHGIHG